MMTVDDIRQILDLVREHDLAEFELEQDGVKLRLRKDNVSPVQVPGAGPPAGPSAGCR